MLVTSPLGVVTLIKSVPPVGVADPVPGANETVNACPAMKLPLEST